jgi:hypothetical protein
MGSFPKRAGMAAIMGKGASVYRLIGFVLLFVGTAAAQDWDVGTRGAMALSEASGKKLTLSFEQRGRYEIRTGNGFAPDTDIDTGLIRTRVGLSYVPVEWLKFSGMMQDSRAPWYGENAPNTVRDPADLHEAYFELLPSRKTGFGASAGRRMLNYGEGRLIGTPQWSNLSRTYDFARASWRHRRAQIEFLLVSPVKIRIDEFNRPVLGDRVWGTYNVFPSLFRESALDLYFLRHEQNRPGGFTGGSAKDGTDKIAIQTLGFRAAGPAGPVRYSVEAAGQWGKTGTADLRSGAWFAGITHRWNFGPRTLDVEVEYKYASGSADPADAHHNSTFDQLYAANHDKFGHQDLFGWRNLHNARSLSTLALTKMLAINFMYDDLWLASSRDALYNSAGRAIARSSTGLDGRHVGREADLFATYRFQHFTFGVGYGHLFPGQFLQRVTPGIGPSYVYIFHTYSL